MIHKIVNLFNRVEKKLRGHLEPLFGGSHFLSRVYYGLFSSTMVYEQYGVMQGKLKYLRDVRSAENANFLLRRNIHRLEKGLIMKPRRDVFAVNYLNETFSAYIACLNNETTDTKGELKWAHDVLSEYFSVTGSDPLIDKLREQFNNLSSNHRSGQPHIPYTRNYGDDLISIEQLESLSKMRRSVRWFTKEKVPRCLVDRALLVGAQSPSACNRQPFSFKLFDDAEIVNKIATIPMGTKGFSHQFPMLAVVIGDLSAYFSERDRHIIYIDASLASMGFLYGLETQGLSSCVINWPEIKEKEKQLSEAIGLQAYERPIFLIAIGWPDKEGMVPFSHKKPIEELRSYNEL